MSSQHIRFRTEGENFESVEFDDLDAKSAKFKEELAAKMAAAAA